MRSHKFPIKLIIFLLTFGILIVGIQQAPPKIQSQLVEGVEKNNFAWIRLMVLLGGQIDEYTTTGETLLSRTIILNYDDTAQWLIENGADVNLSSHSDIAIAQGFTPLMWAAAKGNLNLTNQLLEAGANVNASSGDGITALMWAAALNHEKIVERLLENGADASKKGLGNPGAKEGIDAFTWAKYNEYEAIVNLLEQ